MVPLGSVASFRDITGPYRVEHFNLFPSAAVQGATAPGYSTGYGLAAMEKIAQQVLPDGYASQWTEIAYQEQLAGNTAIFVFAASRGVRVSACSPRNMRAGRCRSPSFSSCPCACLPPSAGSCSAAWT